MEELKQALKRAFATTYAFLVKSENFHWNVTGPNFVQHHELFGKIYDEVDDELDDFAERVRALRCYVPASFSQLAEHSTILDTLEILPPTEMVRTLYVDNGKIHTPPLCWPSNRGLSQPPPPPPSVSACLLFCWCGFLPPPEL